MVCNAYDLKLVLCATAPCGQPAVIASHDASEQLRLPENSIVPGRPLSKCCVVEFMVQYKKVFMLED